MFLNQAQHHGSDFLRACEKTAGPASIRSLASRFR